MTFKYIVTFIKKLLRTSLKYSIKTFYKINVIFKIIFIT